MTVRFPRRLRPCPVAHGEGGFTMIEVAAALGIAAVVSAGLGAAILGGMRGVNAGRNTTEATALARAAVESARSLGWDGLAHPSAIVGDPAVIAGQFDPDGAGPLAKEDLVVSPAGLVDPYITSVTEHGLRFETRVYATLAKPLTGVKRVSAATSFTEGGLTRHVTASTLVEPTARSIGAAAYVLSGVLLGVDVGQVSYVKADSSGGSDSTSVATFAPAGGVSGAGGAAMAFVVPGPRAHAQASVSTLAVSAGSLLLSASGVLVQADSSTSGMTVAATGSVTINGTTYVNPSPGTSTTVGFFRIDMNVQERFADGSMSVTFARITNTTNGEVLNGLWAWVRPASALSA